MLQYHNDAVEVTKSAFYANHITLTGPIAIFFLKSKALLNTDWEIKTTHNQKWH